MELAVKTTQDTLVKIEGMVDGYRQEIRERREHEATLQATLTQAQKELEALDDLLDDVEIARLIQARRDGTTVKVTINKL